MSEHEAPNPEPPAPVAITLTTADGRVATAELHEETVQAIFDHGAGAVVYPASVGTNPEQHQDTFATARQRILNSMLELRAAATSHAIMTQQEQPLAFARHIAEQQTILIFNMLGQAGLLEARMAARQAEMQGMAEEKSIIVPGGEDVKVGQS